ncbi:MAG: large subunit ribosomal protein [Ilumatobacteraceae bacterium]|nr:large subunit ribosomal protein [Ilumatobacteraceae bacterium]
MTGPKLNEASMVAGERSGTKASAKYLRVSAYKARVVLNLIRGLPVKRADEVLQFSDREVSNDIRKVLASAVANAQHNDEQDPDELFVKACFADEGPTLKRFTPRARGRGNRINKRTCHITLVIARLDDDRLEVVQAREAKRTAAGRRRPAAGGTSAGRRARVERSRQRASAAKTGTGGSSTSSKETTTFNVDELPQGAHAPLDDNATPEGFEIKGNADSMLYHLPGTPFYDRTIAEVWFDTAENAEAAGFDLPPSQRHDDDDVAAADESDASEAGDAVAADDEPAASPADAKEDN